MSSELARSLHQFAVEPMEIVDDGAVTLESLVGGHSMAEVAASCSYCSCCVVCCCCCCGGG
ncbi:thiomuracin/GE37468 family thiazolyl RiPP peptide [Rhizohabitans arisaemae]|uniref:thiomuracin/GE37468 family thiazolyl RiPP peptide n=1 Tax=Rhizohabitans arisaemae TaxID=2720610 RepID=UPI0024B22994|nr:thiomuracin/GE37468 family thiazolyl RiPP peptide [Rhizohabitans arisaemae]